MEYKLNRCIPKHDNSMCKHLCTGPGRVLCRIPMECQNYRYTSLWHNHYVDYVYVLYYVFCVHIIVTYFLLQGCVPHTTFYVMVACVTACK